MPDLNAFTCLSIYQGIAAPLYHNEIAFCLDRREPNVTHMSYWIGTEATTPAGGNMHETDGSLGT